MAIFPGSLASFTGFTSSHTLSQDSHAAQHNSEQAEITATQTKIGTGASTPTSGMLLRGNGVGTSVWAQAALTTDVTGVLPIANGGNGTTSTTGTGAAVFGTAPTLASPTLTTPVVADFTSANHNHQNNAGGGLLSAAALPALSLATQSLFNPYKFSVSRSTAWTTVNAETLVQYDTTTFDTSNNVDIITNKGRFTAPVSGFYWFSAQAGTTSIGDTGQQYITLRKNGTIVKTGDAKTSGAAATILFSNISTILQLTAGDYIEVFLFSGSGNTGGTSNQTYFEGFLVSQT